MRNGRLIFANLGLEEFGCKDQCLNGIEDLDRIRTLNKERVIYHCKSRVGRRLQALRLELK